MSQVSRRWRMEWWLLATLAAAGGPPYLATPDVGLGRGDGVPRLGAREVVRVLLPAALPFVGVEDRHPPREVNPLMAAVLDFISGAPYR